MVGIKEIFIQRLRFLGGGVPIDATEKHGQSG
jgi:hypothetical protein